MQVSQSSSPPKLVPINNPHKKKILMLSDDFRLPSGIGTISREIIFNTVQEYDWIQLGAAVKHPESGKGLDLSKQFAKETGIADASVKIIPWDGYGDRNILMTLLNNEKPDAIFHFTDPRYWNWLYALEHEIKNTYNIPFIYYSIWDDLPYPMWNAPFYGSCDLIMGISDQSNNIHREVLRQNGFNVVDLDAETLEPNSQLKSTDIMTSYVPHGLNHNIYKPIHTSDPGYIKMYDDIKKKNGIDFLVMWNNRNIRRKQPGDVILAFKTFRDKLPKEKQDKVGLLMHTEINAEHGTDLRSVWKNVAPECKLIFSEQKISSMDLNVMYNISDLVINIASNEGWGLSSTEAMLSGTNILNNVTGGLQDQCGFVDEEGNLIRFNKEFTSNHNGKYQKHGEWAYVVFPSNRSLQGSPITPYIFDDRANYEDVASRLAEAYRNWEEFHDEYIKGGLTGRDFCLNNGLTAKGMADNMVKCMSQLFEHKTNVATRYRLDLVTQPKYENIGITI